MALIRMSETWIKWEPIPALAEKYYIESILDDIDGFKVLLFDAENKNRKMRIFFENSVDAYKSTDESFRLNSIHILKKQYGANFYGKWTFFKVTNSSYLQWLSEQSYGITDPLELIHFSIIAADSMLDIINGCNPKVELL